MVRGLEFDISEMAITTYLCARPRQSIHCCAGVSDARVPPRRHPAQHEGRHQRAEAPGGQKGGREPGIYRDQGSLGAQHTPASILRGSDTRHVGIARRRACRRTPARPPTSSRSTRAGRWRRCSLLARFRRRSAYRGSTHLMCSRYDAFDEAKHDYVERLARGGIQDKDDDGRRTICRLEIR